MSERIMRKRKGDIMLRGKFVVIGVTGGIAAYKIPNLARLLIKAGAEVQVIMTENAQNFITPFTFETLTKNKCLTDTFDRNFTYSVEHVALAKRADMIVIAPASADVIAKAAHGIADDMLTTVLLAATCRKLIAPAMNHNMYHNPIVEDNMSRLRRFGFEFVGPVCGMLANGDTGDGRMSDEEEIFDYIEKELSHTKDLEGKKVLISAGATEEAIDPVRCITNHSSGRMGLALAKAAAARGACVTVIRGRCEVKFPPYLKIKDAASAEDMYRAAANEDFDIYIGAAAVADYTPAEYSDNKIKKSDNDTTLRLTRTKDILGYLGSIKKEGQFLCGFSMETENMLENSVKKLKEKNLDMIAANNLKTEGAGFKCNTNVLTLIDKDGAEGLPKMSKLEAAHRLLDRIAEKIK